MSSLTEPVKDVFVQQQILSAAKQLFQTHGLYKVTMDDVAKAIGKGRSSLYYYYKSKEEIFDAVMGVEIREMLKATSDALAKAHTIEEKIRAFFFTKLVTISEKQAFFNMLDVGMDAAAMTEFKRVKVAHHNFIMKQEGALMQQVLINAMERGEIAHTDKKETAMLVFVLLSSLRGLKREMSYENNFDDIEPALNSLIKLVVHGLKK